MGRRNSNHRKRQKAPKRLPGESEQERINRLYSRPPLPGPCEPAPSARVINEYFRTLATDSSCQQLPGKGAKKRRKKRRAGGTSSRTTAPNSPATIEPDWWRERGE